MSNVDFSGITLEDVETAIQILQYYIRCMQRAQMVLRQLSSVSGVGGTQRAFNPSLFTFEDFVNMAVEVEKRKHGIVSSGAGQVESQELSEEDIKKMKELVRKVKERKVQAGEEIKVSD